MTVVRKAHVKRCIGRTRSGDGSTFTDNDEMWLDVYRIDELDLNLRSDGQTTRVTIKWQDADNSETDAKENNVYGENRELSIQRSTDPEDPPREGVAFLDPDTYVAVSLIDKIIIKDATQEYEYKFRNLNVEQDGSNQRIATTRDVKVLRIPHHETSRESELNDADGTRRIVDADSYQVLSETKDDTQYIDMEVIKDYTFTVRSDYKDIQGKTLINQSIANHLKNLEVYEAMGLQEDALESSGVNSRQEDVIPARMDPFQSIVNVQWGGAVEFNRPVTMEARPPGENPTMITMVFLVRIPADAADEDVSGTIMTLGPKLRRILGTDQEEDAGQNGDPVTTTFQSIINSVSIGAGEDETDSSFSFQFGSEMDQAPIFNCGAFMPICHPRQLTEGGGAICTPAGFPLPPLATGVENVIKTAPMWDPLSNSYVMDEYADFADSAFLWNGESSSADQQYQIGIRGSARGVIKGAWNLCMLSVDTNTNKITIAVNNRDYTEDEYELENGTLHKPNRHPVFAVPDTPSTVNGKDSGGSWCDPEPTPEFENQEELDDYLDEILNWPHGWAIDVDVDPVTIPSGQMFTELEDPFFVDTINKVQFGPVLVWFDYAADWRDQSIRELFCRTNNDTGKLEFIRPSKDGEVMQRFGEPKYWFTGGPKSFPHNLGTVEPDTDAVVEDGELKSYSPSPKVLGEVIPERQT